jgi:transcription elongation factor Elf1
VTTPEPAPEVQASTPTVRTACPACNQQFAVEMPPEISEAMVACPKCEQRIKLQR